MKKSEKKIKTVSNIKIKKLIKFKESKNFFAFLYNRLFFRRTVSLNKNF